jgi:hypothetical protein
MGWDYTTTALIDNVKLRATMPTSQNLFTDERILMLANDELQTVIFPMIMSTKGDYFLNINTQTMASGTFEYDIPADAVGLKIKSCYWRDPNWQDNQPDVLIPQVSVQDVTNNSAGAWNYLAFYLQDNKVILTNVSPGMYLRQRYYKRASKLVTDDEGALVTDGSTTNIVVDNLPSDWVVGDILTLTSSVSPLETISTTLQITAIPATNTLNLVNTDASAAVITQAQLEGSWLTQEDETVIVQITPEAFPILAQSVAVKCLEAVSDPNLGSAQIKFEQLKKNFIDTMTPRVDGLAKIITNRNGTLFWNKVTRNAGWGGW